MSLYNDLFAVEDLCILTVHQPTTAKDLLRYNGCEVKIVKPRVNVDGKLMYRVDLTSFKLSLLAEERELHIPPDDTERNTPVKWDKAIWQPTTEKEETCLSA